MSKERIIQSYWFNRLGEVMIPILSYTLILLPIWLAPFHPAIVAYFILGFDLFFFYKSLTTSFYAVKAYKEIQYHMSISYKEKLKEIADTKHLEHFIIIPNYKEPLYKIEATIQAITENDYPYKTHLMLAFEKREEEAKEKERYLKEKYSDKFKMILSAYHVLTDGEVPGKASNQTFAAKKIKEYVDSKNIQYENTIITICDADSHLSPNYFSYLTYEYMKDSDHQYHFYWAPVLLYSNFWKLPFFVRMQATLDAIIRLALSAQKEKLIHISTYSTSLWLLNEVTFWDVDIIPEDWHIYFQAFFKFGSKVRTLPIYTLNRGDAVYSGKLYKTFLNRYEQEKRWAWGLSDVSYAWSRLFNTPHIPFLVKFKKFLQLAETHLLWPSSFFLLTVSASIVPLVNPVFKRTVLGFLLPQISGVLLTISTGLLLLYIYLDVQLRKKMNIELKLYYLPILLVQWYLMPFVSFCLSSLPALDAHTRMLFGKKITYKVTEKV